MKKIQGSRAIAIIGITGGIIFLLGLNIGKADPPMATIRLPGPYPYETPVQVPAPPPVAESSPLPSPAPFPYPDSIEPASAHDSRTTETRRSLTPKAVREAAFKYNGVSHFWGFLAALPANVSVFDPQLGRTRAVVEGGHVVRKNAVWLRKHKQAAAHSQADH
ncbi:MAG TPA: hypothetical protein VFQ83_06095 [Candidatus Udaeobacter sp.]|jgi:hypothetical protein|nr:hypothetical protein [Candidatus Udaeobacter sp.]